ncbi:MAG: DegT/DnrJ/EryC1/StrS family aminotransferase [Candidatus Delongbacteria bacterium]|nr:DegT/DnrJ/EryC1/StrS family aminotransferase [Candidatus Delongbacteria bacterium]
MREIKFLDLKAQYLSIKEEIDCAIQEVLLASAFAGGPFVKSFEENFAKIHDAKFCAGVNNGTSALHIAMMGLNIGEGDEIIMPANTFIATPASVSLQGAKPVFVDCSEEDFNIDVSKIEEAITKKTKAILPVHLFGQPAKMDVITEIAEKHGLMVIEDCAQAHLAEFQGKKVGTIGVAGCFSFYPGKNLGAYGEGGAVISNDEEFWKKIQAIKEHGSFRKYHHEYLGHNYRLEGIQGAILDVKLKYIEAWTETRRKNADLYRKYLSGVDEIILPEERGDVRHVYHLFVIRTEKRDDLAEYLNENGVQTGIHYPIPCHLQRSYGFMGYKKGDFPVSEKLAKEILSLPMSEQLKEDEIVYIAEKIREYFVK